MFFNDPKRKTGDAKRSASFYKKNSIINYLKKKNRINDEFVVMFNSLSLEEVIAIKLETSSRSLNGKLFNLPLWKLMPIIARDALIRFVTSASQNGVEASNFIGIPSSKLYRIWKNNPHPYHFDEFMIPEEENELVDPYSLSKSLGNNINRKK